ncbi:TolC family protein [Gracilimonas amylolytica]|uniref:TolC family protein n=1 Tax=Gracilimonas amylolytica TaxID=1749045 RepID=UPI000CD8720C|nr:TolC family protein [Gracilimonas amylolytica]
MNYRNSYVPKVYLMAAMLLLPLQLFSQGQVTTDQTLSLSLQEAMELAVDQNFNLEQAGYDVDKTKAQFRQTNAVFLPQVSFEYNAISTDDPLNVFGFKLKQEVVSQQDFNPVLLNDPDAYENYSAKFEVRQPLINPDMFLQRSAMKSQLNSANEQLEGTKNYVRYQVRQQYYNLILHNEQIEVLESALKTAGEHRRQAQNYFEEGLISKEDYLSAKVYELDMESRMLQTKNALEKVQEDMALLLGLEGNTTVQPTDELNYELQADAAVATNDFEVNNAQTRAIDYKVQAAKKMVRASEFSFIPKINLFGSYEFNDNEFAGFDASSYMIGANLRWDIFSGFSKVGKVMEAKADYRKAQSMQESHRLDQENKVRQAMRSIDHATKQISLTEQAIEQSTEDVKIRTNRYVEGMERTTDLLEAETKLAEAKLKNVMALYQYNMSIAALEMLLENDLKN